MKTKSKIRILLGTLPFLLLLGVFAQPEPEAGAKPEDEVAASPAPESGVRSETEAAAPSVPETVVKSEAEPAAQTAAVPAAKAEPETVVRLDPVTVSAKTPEQLYLDAVVLDPAVPCPVAVSFPSFRDLDYGTNYGRTLEVEFVVGADGVPRNFRMVQPTL
jgi:hypothetical protein